MPKINGVTYKLHPACKMFPKFTPELKAAFLADVRENGIRQKLKAKQMDGYVLVYDGQNRLDACAELGIDPPWEEFDGDEARLIADAVAANLLRRDLNPGQRACLAVLAESHEVKTRGKAKRSNKKPTAEEKALSEEKGVNDQGEITDVNTYLAEKFGCSRPYVFKARALKENSDALFEEVLDGSKVLTEAYAEWMRSQSAPEPAAHEAADDAGGGETAEDADGPEPEPEADAEVLDGLGNPVPKKFREVFACRNFFDEAFEDVRKVKRHIREVLAPCPGSHHLDAKQAEANFEAAAKYLRLSQPHMVCLSCRGKKCADCDDQGWVNKVVGDAQIKAKVERDRKKAERAAAKEEAARTGGPVPADAEPAAAEEAAETVAV